MAAYDIVCVAFPSWEGNYVKSTVKLMEALARRHRVLYIDYQYTWKDALMGVLKPGTVPVSRLLGLSGRLREVKVGEATVHVLTPPPVLPVNFLTHTRLYDGLQRLNARLVLRAVRNAYHQLAIQNPVVINAFNPSVGIPLAGKLGEQCLIYYCYDEISTCAWAQKHGARSEKNFVETTDAVVVSSDGLLTSKKPFGKPVYLVHNGVDFEEFQKIDIPASEPATPKAMGYVGSIDSRLNYDLLTDLARRLPGQELVMVGRIVYDKPHVQAAIEALRALPNVRFTGAKTPQELPGILAGFQVGLIPFVKNEQTAAIYPMKINEYLAVGLPVVSTDFAPLEAFGEVVAVCPTKNSFIEAVRAARGPASWQARQERIEVARQNSWPERARELEAIIDKVIRDKNGKNVAKPGAVAPV